MKQANDGANKANDDWVNDEVNYQKIVARCFRRKQIRVAPSPRLVFESDVV